MISRIIKKTVDLSKVQKVDQLEGPLYQLENGGHTFEITCLMDGAAADISGTVSARFLRQDEVTVYFTGTLSGNVASITLPQSCYNVNGRFGLVVFVAGNDITTAVYAVAGSVYRSTSEHIIDPTEEIPSLEDLIAKIQDCEDATEAAEAAAAFVPNVIAPAYSVSATYAVGDYCTKDGYLYRCNTAISTAEAWTAAHWTQVTAGAEIGDINSALGFTAFDDIPDHSGFLGSSGTWTYATGVSYKHKVLAIKPGDVVKITYNTSAGNPYIGFLTTYTTPVTDAAVPYSTATGFTGRIQLSSGTGTKIAPSDANYLVIQTKTSANTYAFTSVSVNGVDITKTISDNLQIMGREFADVSSVLQAEMATKVGKDQIFDGFVYPQIWDSGTYNSAVGVTLTTSASSTRRRTRTVLQFDFPVIVRSAGTYSFAYRFVDANNEITASRTTFSTAPFEIPANQRFVLVIANAADTSQSMADVTDSAVNADITIGDFRLSDIIDSVDETTLNWVAMGDSITEGWYSAFDGTGGAAQSHTDASKTWVSKCAKLRKWAVTNKGIGGTGWVFKGNSGTANNAYEQAAAIAAETGGFGRFDFVTLAYGVNDWKGNVAIGTLTDDITGSPTAVIPAMRKTIETILTSNPTIKIFVILPLNLVGYNYAYGTEATNWAFGYAGFSNSGQFGPYIETLKSVCDYYGIQYIDQSHYSVVNRKNLLTALPDGVHPSVATHTALAHELAGKINVV